MKQGLSNINIHSEQNESWRNQLLKTHNNRKTAFTLAEVLITLGIIGVVAALTIPMFMENISDRIKASRIENIKQKLSKVTDKMASLDKLQGYQSTGEFVDEMKNHMNIAKICKDHVENCWPTSEITIRKHAPATKSNTYQISKIISPDELRLHTEFINWAEPVGIITGDGISMILSYNKDCPITSDTGLVFDQASATSNSLSCISGIYDWNGKSKPNAMGDDIQSLGSASIAGSCTAEVKMNDGSYLCTAGSAHIPTPLTSAHCRQYANEGKFGIPADKDCRFGTNYWLGAVVECGGMDNMLSTEELGKIAEYVYDVSLGTVPISKRTETKNFLNSGGSKRALSIGLPDETPFHLWSKDYSSGGRFSPDNMKFGPSYIYMYAGAGGENTSSILVLCKGD